MYPGQEGGSANRQAPQATNRASYGQTSQQSGQRMAPTILPQPVLLVGYTPDGAAILMSNTTQNSVSQMTTQPSPAYATNRDQQVATNQMQTVSPVATTTPGYAPPTSQELMTNIFQTQSPVMAVPTTILGPDGNAYTALVKPSSQQGMFSCHYCSSPHQSSFLPIFVLTKMPCNRGWNASYRARSHLYWRNLSIS